MNNIQLVLDCVSSFDLKKLLLSEKLTNHTVNVNSYVQPIFRTHELNIHQKIDLFSEDLKQKINSQIQQHDTINKVKLQNNPLKINAKLSDVLVQRLQFENFPQYKYGLILRFSSDGKEFKENVDMTNENLSFDIVLLLFSDDLFVDAEIFAQGKRNLFIDFPKYLEVMNLSDL